MGLKDRPKTDYWGSGIDPIQHGLAVLRFVGESLTGERCEIETQSLDRPVFSLYITYTYPIHILYISYTYPLCMSYI